MKKLLFSVMFLLSVVASHVLAESGHFTFNGIPIDGNMSTFIDRCADRDYSLKERAAGTALLAGTFHGMVCDVLAETLPSEDCLWGVTVFLPSCDSWKELSACYGKVKDTFVEEYGTPVHCVERFLDVCGSDSLKMKSVRDGGCSYKSVFETETGQVDVAIWYDVIRGSCVLVSFIDKANSLRQ